MIFFASVFCATRVFAQTTVPIFGLVSGGLASGSNISVGQNQQAIFGFSVKTNTAALTIKQYNIAIGQGAPATYFANATLYRSSSASSYSGGTQVGNVNLSNSGYVTITNLTETVTTTNVYYYLVVDVIGGTGNFFQLSQGSGSLLCIDVNGTQYTGNFYSSIPGNNYGSNFQGYSINSGTTPYLVSLYSTTPGTIDAASGLANTATPLTSGLTNQPLFGFKLTTTSTTTFTALNINSSLSGLSSYFSGFKLYSNSSNTFTGATQVAGVTATISGSFVKFSGSLSTATTGPYYFLVANVSFTGSPTLPASVQFNLQTQQATNAALAVGGTTYNDFTAFGDTYSLNAAALTVVGAQNGLSSATITPGQSDIAMFGFGVSSGSTITVSGFNINSASTTGNAATYFGNGRLYKNTSNNYTGATLLAGSTVPGTSVTFSGNYATITGLTETISSTPVYYFLVADDIGGTTGGPTTTFNFTNGQSLGAVVESAPTVTSYNNFTVTGNPYTIPLPTIKFSINTTGFTTTSTLVAGQTNTVIYGVTLTPTGNISMQSPFMLFNSSNGNITAYFQNSQLKLSTSGTYVGATPVSGVTLSNNGGVQASFSGTLTFTQGTTYTYYLVSDIVTSGTPTLPQTIPISVNKLYNNNLVQIDGATYSFSGVTYTGTIPTTTYTITNGYDWVGGNSTFNTLSNFHVIGSGTVASSLPTSSTSILVGVNQTYSQTGLTIPAGTTLSSLSVSNAFGPGSPTINLASGTASTITNGVNILNGASVTINGTSGGGLTLPSGSISSTSTSSTLAIAGGATLANAGTFTTGASSNITLAGSSTLSNSGTFTLASTATIGSITSSTLTNTGTFTLASDASGTAMIGKVTSGTINGSYIAQRYMPGGANSRGYRLLSAPVASQLNKPISGINSYDLTQLVTTSYISGPGTGGTIFSTANNNGFDVTATGSASAFVYKESDPTPTSTNISVSDYKGFASTSEYLPLGNGILFYYRGDRSQNQAGATAGNAFVSPYPVPNPATFSFLGNIITGNITVNVPVFSPTASYYNVLGTANAPSNTQTVAHTAAGFSSTLSYTNNGTSNTDGFNLVGNPYPSAIDLEGITLNGSVGTTFYTLNANNSNGFGTYQRTGTGATGIGLNGGSRYILPGEGFFAKASGTGASIVFTENSKSAYPTGTGTTGPAAVFSLKIPTPTIRIKLVQDTNLYNETVLSFNNQNSNKFSDADNDASFMASPSELVFLYSLSSDSIPCAINRMGSIDNAKPVRLFVQGSVTGIYKLQFSGMQSVDPYYRIYLKDALLKDSLDVTANSTYSFAVDRLNPATYGAGRFTLVVYKTSGTYKLDNFAASLSSPVVNLNWTTENEGDVYTFTVERSNNGGSYFSSIGTVQSSSASNYSLVDNNPLNGDNIYRLKQVDALDSTKHSTLLHVQVGSSPGNNNKVLTVSAYPNPVSDMVTIALPQLPKGAMQVQIVNATGKVLKTEVMAPTQQFTENLSALQTGTYIVKIVDIAYNIVIGDLKLIKI